MTDTTPNFDDIRPYNDSEVPAAIQRIIADPEFIRAIIRYRFGSSAAWLVTLASPVLSWYLRRHWAGLKTVAAVQQYVATYLQRSLANTTKRLTCSGLEGLDPHKTYLFVSNHRDIAMDPALVNWCLSQAGFPISRIAIGDNLLKKTCVTELMKLNKCFIVRRSAKGPREMLKALGQLSAYIRYSLLTGHHIWIAQKEGRAKDGCDQTDPAILKMFYIAGKQAGIDFPSYMASLNIVPVSLSYEFDPCDEAKAQELYQLATAGNYQKTEFEDIESIVKGITGQKGRVHVHFGKVVQDPAELADPEALATALDQQIYQGYRFYPANYAAAQKPLPVELAAEGCAEYQRRLQAMPAEIHPFIAQMYASPLLNFEKLAEKS